MIGKRCQVGGYLRVMVVMVMMVIVVMGSRYYPPG